MSRNVTWMEWHGRQTAQDDMPLLSELHCIQEHSVILPASTTSDLNSPTEIADLLDDIRQVPHQYLLVPFSTPGPSPVTLDINTPHLPPIPCVHPVARRNIMESASRPTTRASTAEERGIALRTRSRVSFSDAGVNTAVDDSWSPENMEEHIYNASLQSDYALGVPKNFKE